MIANSFAQEEKEYKFKRQSIFKQIKMMNEKFLEKKK